ncbi:uncharacterized protein LOC123310388 [Coccinella septempunctata]|uniref:uncharacterized protein LOC123310388 n=1 Tax=Coccinella septempunctata TaxID=41139 RepID=UPI001D086518|nr:uncharacterized protein LOC123310388 [Coccinella septempunctata]
MYFESSTVKSDTISTIHDAAEYGFYVTYSRHLKKNLMNRYPELEDYFLSRFVYADEENWTDLVAYNKNTVAMKSLISSKYIKEKCLDEKGKPLIHMLKEPIQKSNYLIYYQRNHPLWSRFPYFINLLRDHGFLQIIELKYVTGDNIVVSEVDDAKKLGLSHVEGPFLMWILGHVAAIIFFIFEKVFGRKLC